MSNHPIVSDSGGLVKADPLAIIGHALGYGPVTKIAEPAPEPPEPGRSERPRNSREAADARQRRADEVDLALFEQVALERSEAAFSELYDRYSPRLYAMMLHYVRVEEDALDLLQDTFILLWEKAPLLYREKTHARAAIYHFARNCALDAVRARRRRKQHFVPLPEDQPTLDDLMRDDRTPESNLNAKEARQHLREGLLLLSEMQRTVIDLAYFGGLSYEEIAERLKIPHSRVRSAIVTSIRKLAKVLRPRFNDAVETPENMESEPEESRKIQSAISIIPYGND